MFRIKISTFSTDNDVILRYKLQKLQPYDRLNNLYVLQHVLEKLT